MTQKELSLVIPAFNEKEIISQHILEIQDWMTDNLPEVSYEVMIINDGSTDGMGEMLDKAASTNPNLRVKHHQSNLGRGQAIRTAIEATNSDFMICLDADLSYDPEHIGLLYQPLKKNEADLTLASPYHPDGKVSNVPAQRAWLSRFGNKLLSYGFKQQYYTITCVVRGFRREVLDNLELISTDKELHLEILQKSLLLGYRVKEIPSHLKWRDKERGQKKGIFSSLVIFSMWDSILSHLLFNYSLRPSFIFILPVLFLIGTVVLAALSICFALISNFQKVTSSGFFSHIYHTLRVTLIEGQLTFIILVSAAITLMIFLVFYFLANQNKKHFDEQFILFSRLNARLKQLDKDNPK